jgi:hypothetical protein
MGKTIEVDELEFNNGQETIAAVRKIMAHPKAALLVEQARKLVDPNAPTPRLDNEKTVNEPVEKLQAKIDELNKKIEDDKAEREKNSKLETLQRRVEAGNAKLLQQGWTADGIKALDEFREKEGIIDPMLAAPAYENLHGAQVAPATPSSHFGRWDFTEPSTQDENYTKKLLETRGESESLVTQEAMKALKEFRGGRQ